MFHGAIVAIVTPFRSGTDLAHGLLVKPTSLGLGSQEVGAKFRFPLPRARLFDAGAVVSFVMGTAVNKEPGFNYLNTRRDSDIRMRLIQSLRFQDKWGIPNLHLNEGYIVEHGDDMPEIKNWKWPSER